ncbi:hypothetical protein GS421_15355 [Rhodococcus hoagii]|nr:hypothetical protein [Prescottella equi]
MTAEVRTMIDLGREYQNTTVACTSSFTASDLHAALVAAARAPVRNSSPTPTSSTPSPR